MSNNYGTTREQFRAINKGMIAGGIAGLVLSSLCAGDVHNLGELFTTCFTLAAATGTGSVFGGMAVDTYLLTESLARYRTSS